MILKAVEVTKTSLLGAGFSKLEGAAGGMILALNVSLADF